MTGSCNDNQERLLGAAFFLSPDYLQATPINSFLSHFLSHFWAVLDPFFM